MTYRILMHMYKFSLKAFCDSVINLWHYFKSGYYIYYCNSASKPIVCEKNGARFGTNF